MWAGGAIRLWALIAAGVFAAAGLFAPALLRPLNRVWFLFGMILHKVVNPLVMGLLFYATITPMAFVMRLMGKDPLRRRFDPEAKSYWIERRPAGPEPPTATRRPVRSMGGVVVSPARVSAPGPTFMTQ